MADTDPLQILKKLLAGAAVAVAVGAPLTGASAAPAVPIVQAAANGDMPALLALLDAGADPNARGTGGRTALMEAARAGRFAIVRALLVHGADKALADDAGRTAFDEAVARGHVDLIALLRDAE
ncbi:ankyrin repeat domain-containing protein [Piscinibacter koreensis]|nr:ankyrin repeat domain-containing protein [Schlegelella koreensis]